MTRSLATLLPLPAPLFPRFSSGGLYERAKYISRTCNYANTSNYRAVGRSGCERTMQESAARDAAFAWRLIPLSMKYDDPLATIA